MADRGQQASPANCSDSEGCCCCDKAERGGLQEKRETLTLEQRHSAGEKLTDGAWVIKHEELYFVSSQKAGGEKKKEKEGRVGGIARR